MTKWEYCAIAGIHKFPNGRGFDTYYPEKWSFLPDTGTMTSEITGGREKETKDVGRLIAKLGEEGWELVGSAPYC
jgi:hypothetical protein